jgi:hypothetical protein
MKEEKFWMKLRDRIAGIKDAMYKVTEITPPVVCSMKQKSDPSSTRGFKRNDHGTLGKNTLYKFIVGKLGLQQCRCLCTSPLQLLNIHCFEHRYLYSACIAIVPASTVLKWVTTHIHPRVFQFFSTWQLFPCPFNYFQMCILKSTLRKVLLYTDFTEQFLFTFKMSYGFTQNTEM